MQQINFLFETSPWFLLLCLVIAAGYAFVVYFKTKNPWSLQTNIILGILRFLFVFVICILLLGPLIRQVFNSYEKPVVVVALDNSQSIAEIESPEQRAALLERIRSLSTSLSENDYDVEIKTFDESWPVGQVDSIHFNHNQSNLNEILQEIQNEYESRNLSNVVLISDGIYNLGNNPVYQPYSFAINTVGIGDTIQKPDLILNNLVYNKIAYQGNKFPLIVEFFSVGYIGETLEIEIVNRGQIIEKRELEVSDNNQYFEEQFYIEAKEKGFQQYKVLLKEKENELSSVNNQKDAFVDVVEGKERILIAAPFPHPDIKAIRSAVSDNKNYEVLTYIEGIDKMPEGQFDVYILHQIPNIRNTHNQLLNRINEENLPVWYILGPLSNLTGFNESNHIVEIQLINNQKDDVFTYLNPGFATFRLTDESNTIFRKYPPVSVPFANFTISSASDVILYQKVGSIETDKPLFMVSTGDRKEAVLIGSGGWQWRLAEYAQNESTGGFDEMVTKTIQYLSAKDDRRKFKVYPVKNEFYTNEPIVFETEAYNDIYERIYGQEVGLILKDENGNSNSYQYVTSEANSRYTINNLIPGVYQFTASADINGQRESSTGSFIVKELQIEQTVLTANHQLLRNLANENGGNFYSPDDLDKLSGKMTQLKAQSVIHSQEDYLSIINIKWVFFLILLLFSIEWFLRKYHGSY